MTLRLPCAAVNRNPNVLRITRLWVASPRLCPMHGESLALCTILTTTPNAVFQPIHDRMPVILRPGAYSLRLDPTMREVEPLQPLLAPYPAEQMIASPVSPRVNSPAYDSPECVAPLA